jgi:hypothetical protein
VFMEPGKYTVSESEGSVIVCLMRSTMLERDILIHVGTEPVTATSKLHL